MMKKILLCVSLLMILSWLPIKRLNAEDAGYAMVSSVLSEYYSILDREGTGAAMEYLEAQYALHPECAAMSFCLGALKSEWDDSYFIYTATEEACSYFENAYSIDATSPDSIWGQGLVAYRNQDYDQALIFMTDFLSYISPSPDAGNLSISSSAGIISRLDQYSTAAFIILNCCANCNVPDDSLSLSALMTQTYSLLDSSRFNPKTLRRGMQVLYYSVQYAEQTGSTALAYQYAQDFTCIYHIIERDWMLSNGLSGEISNLDEIADYLTEMLAIAYYCLDILEPYYFQSTTF